MRNRSQTIGTLGRTPARTSKGPPLEQQPAPPVEPPQPRGRVAEWFHGALFENTGLKFLSLVLAVTVFLLITTDKPQYDTGTVDVKYVYPSDRVLVSEELKSVKVTVRGRWRHLRDFDHRQLGQITLDLRNTPTGDVAITTDMIGSVPPGLEVTEINPRTVRVVFDKRVEKVVEVVPVTTGRPLHGYTVEAVKTVPATITISGATRVLAALTSIRTTEISLEGRTESFDTLVELVTPEGVSVDSTQRITVDVRFKVDLVTKKIPDLPVVIGGDGIDAARWKIAPTTVDVTLTGPLLDVEAAKSSMVVKAVLLPADKTAREVKVIVEGVKEGVGVKISPERVTVTPVKPTAPP